MTDSPDSTEWRAYLYAVTPAVLVFAVGPGLVALSPDAAVVETGAVRWVGVVAAVVGFALVAWAVHAFARASQVPSPTDVPDQLVTAGPLGYTRNPIYLGTVLAIAGEAVVFRSTVLVAYSGSLWLVYHLLIVYREEPALRSAFGDRYEQYCDDVPRWV